MTVHTVAFLLFEYPTRKVFAKLVQQANAHLGNPACNPDVLSNGL